MYSAAPILFLCLLRSRLPRNTVSMLLVGGCDREIGNASVILFGDGDVAGIQNSLEIGGKDVV